jgi:ParB family chromosome partitioning protein
MTRLAQRVVDEKLSVRKTEELVREMLGSPRETSSAMPQRGSTTPDEFHQASRLMREALELPVRVKSLKSGGKVEIHFRQTEELQALVSLLTSRIDD